MPISKEIEKKIIKHIEAYEYRHNGMRWVNGGCVNVEDVEIDEDENEVRCKVTLEFQADQRTTIFHNCHYPLDEILKGIS